MNLREPNPNELLDAISRLTNDWVYSLEVGTDGSLTWEWVAGGFELVTGYSPEEAADRGGWQTLLHPDDLVSAGETFERLLTTGQSNVTEFRLITRSGDTRWVRAYAHPVMENGRAVRLYGAVQDITERHEKEEAERRAGQDREKLVTHLVRAKEEERSRLAAEIHDDSVQIMTSVAIDLERLGQRISDRSQGELVERLENSVRAAIRRLRAMVFDLKPPALDTEGLGAALRLYLEEYTMESGITHRFDNHLDGEPAPDTRVTLFRVAKEALTNVRKHAGATQVWVRLAPDQGEVRLVVEDDGSGISSEDILRLAAGHIGIGEMRQRAEMAGGTLRIEPRPAGGTRVECRLPTHPQLSEVTA